MVINMDTKFMGGDIWQKAKEKDVAASLQPFLIFTINNNGG